MLQSGPVQGAAGGGDGGGGGGAGGFALQIFQPFFSTEPSEFQVMSPTASAPCRGPL